MTMLLLGILLILLFGYSFVNYLDEHKTEMEKWGLSFLLGMGFVTVCMFMLEVTGVRISLLPLYLLLISGIFLLNRPYLTNNEGVHLKKKLQSCYRDIQFTGWKSGNWLWYGIMVFVVCITIASILIGLYWPPFEYDNITAYDLMGKVIAAEGQIDNSLFNEAGKPVEGTDKRLIYPPLSSGSFAFAYLHGLQTSKIVTALYSLFFVLTFYTFLSRETNYLNGMLGTFLVIIVPAFFKHSTRSTVNFPFTIYMALGIICLYFWITGQKRSDLILGSILLGLSAWTRSEGIVFVAVGFLAVLFIAYRTSRWNNLLWYSLCSFPLFIAWFLFARFNFDVTQNILHPFPYFDFAKWSVIINYLYEFLFSLQLFGLTAYAFVLAVFIHTTRLHRDTSTYLLVLILSCLFCITLFYYQIDYTRFSRLDGVMTFAYLRGLLCFIPLFWFYVLSSEKMRRFGEWINRQLESTA